MPLNLTEQEIIEIEGIINKMPEEHRTEGFEKALTYFLNDAKDKYNDHASALNNLILDS